MQVTNVLKILVQTSFFRVDNFDVNSTLFDESFTTRCFGAGQFIFKTSFPSNKKFFSARNDFFMLSHVFILLSWSRQQRPFLGATLLRPCWRSRCTVPWPSPEWGQSGSCCSDRPEKGAFKNDVTQISTKKRKLDLKI